MSIDEVDQLEEKNVLYDLYRARNISLILIANREEELFAQLDDRLTSRFHSSERVQFDKYRLDELVSILDARVRWALSEDVIGKQELALVADAAAGDARIAPSMRVLKRIHIARASTPWQHLSLLRDLRDTVSKETGVVVLPEFDGFYRSDEVSETEGGRILAEGVTLVVEDVLKDDFFGRHGVDAVVRRQGYALGVQLSEKRALNVR